MLNYRVGGMTLLSFVFACVQARPPLGQRVAWVLGQRPTHPRIPTGARNFSREAEKNYKCSWE